MSHHRFEQMWILWHFTDNAKMDSCSGRLFKIQLVLDYFLHKFQKIYKPKQQLSLDERMHVHMQPVKIPDIAYLFRWCARVTLAVYAI